MQPGSRSDAAGNGDTGPVAPPAISLPRGGGAIRGIGETFAANPVTGTGQVSVPLAVSPGRSGFGPTLALEYDSGAGNGPFGFGWHLSLPAIMRRTDRGVPRYRAHPEDEFVLSGAEDLVPELAEDAGTWRPVVTTRTVGGRPYAVQRFHPRVEGAFARIERWRDTTSGDVHWRSTTGDNVTTLYGQTAESRVADPADPDRIFSWLICESHDDRGNAVVYDYKAEDGVGVDLAAAHEGNRTDAGRTANRYLKRIRYGNRVSRLVAPDLAEAQWLFEVVFDFGEHDDAAPLPAESAPWPGRPDPFSSHRAGFEVRTYRRCRRVLMFHHFPEAGEVGRDCLVRSTDLTYADSPVASFVTAIAQRGYRRRPEGGYRTASLPALEFAYSAAVIDDRVHEVDPASLANVTTGEEDWVDLDGEGLSGLLTTASDGWYYKPNLGDGRLGDLRAVPTRPSLAGTSAGRPQLLDLAGDGQLDVVDLAGPTPGFYERTAARAWADFRPFPSRPSIDWDDPHLRLVDLTGDGHADVLLGDGDALSWHASLGERGFGPARRVDRPGEDEAGPQLLFADDAHAVLLADMSGDGLPDVVRVGNGDVCYWPNLGHGRFGRRVRMDDAPGLDEPDQFDRRRVRLADVDGSGTTDLLYLHRDGVRLYANHSGNGWGPPRRLSPAFPRADSLARVDTMDLLGRGTACLVWASPTPTATGRSLRYIDLMGGSKPHLLATVRNNLGAETHVAYAPSTRFYLADQAAGRPWATRLPFPVHVVERVETVDRVSGNRFVTRYAYHHGCYDGVEREFRGFGLVEQFDTESLTGLGATNEDPASHVPPVLTRTWFHVGADVAPYAPEYFDADPDLRPPATVPPTTVRRPGADPQPWWPTPDETREAARALKGSILRQETYGLDGGPAAGRPYATSERTYTIELRQPASAGAHAVFVVHPRETVSAQYERALHPVDGQQRTDPRVSHDMTLAVDDFGQVLRAVAVAYGRRHDDPDPTLSTEDRELQRRIHIVTTDNRFTNAIDEDDAYRWPVPAETREHEVVSLTPTGRIFGFAELAGALDGVGDELPPDAWDVRPARPARRLVEHTRTRYRRDDLSGPLDAGVIESRALPFESLRLALPDGLLSTVYGDRVDDAMVDAAGYRHEVGGRWLPSGRVQYAPTDTGELDHARAHFFLPHRFRDPFDAVTSIGYDVHDLLPVHSRDPVANAVTAEVDYRVLQPHLLTDPNGNRAAVAYDTLGLVVGTALLGRAGEDVGDTLDGFDADPGEAALAAYLADPLAAPHDLLSGATTRLVYDLFAYARTRADDRPQPSVVATLSRETHVSDATAGASTAIQHRFAYSDGFGREIQQKVRAEPDAPDSARWAGTGWTVFNNKGQPVREFEPFFSATHRFEFDVTVGVGSVRFYDPLARVVATVHPNDTWDKVVVDAWHHATWDVNDTVLADPADDPDIGGLVRPYVDASGGWLGWHAQRIGGGLGAAERLAAERAAAHAGTPTHAWLDALGRPGLTVTHNRVSGVDERRSTRVRLDIEGNEREVVDALDRLAMRYGYDLLATRISLKSMEAGVHRLLVDVAGQPVVSWNDRGFRTRTTYDALRRPTESFVLGGDGGEALVLRTVYGEGQPEADAGNLRTRVFRQFDGAGIVTTAYDFKGNPRESTRQLSVAHARTLDWRMPEALQPRLYTTRTRFDALNRPVAATTADGSVIRPTYNEAGLLERLEANLRGAAESTGFIDDVDYNARGQRTLCRHANGTTTEYGYDPLTFRLATLRTARGGTLLQDLRYTYDPAGNVVHIHDAAQQTLFFAGTVVEPTADYTYDALYRLIEANGREHLGQGADGGRAPVPTSSTDVPRVGRPHPDDGQAMARYRQRYVYDAVGNILSMAHAGTQPAHPGWTRTYAYGEQSLLEPDRSSNRLTSTSDGGPGSPVPLTYDEHGNVTSLPELPAMRWDHQDRLQATSRQRVTGGGVPETTYYVYDAAGGRVRKVTERQAPAGQSPEVKAERVYLGGVEIYREYGPGGAVTLERETLHVLDGNRRVALVETRTAGQDAGAARLTRFQLTNHLDSACLELDDAGQIITYEEFYPYGSTSYQAVRSATETPKRYRFTGRERDDETGLAHHGARYYAAWLGRWTSCDPAGLVDGPNVYLAMRANPLRFVDLTGRQAAPHRQAKQTKDFKKVTLKMRAENDVGTSDRDLTHLTEFSVGIPLGREVHNDRVPGQTYHPYTDFKLILTLGHQIYTPQATGVLPPTPDAPYGTYIAEGQYSDPFFLAAQIVGVGPYGQGMIRGFAQAAAGWDIRPLGEDIQSGVHDSPNFPLKPFTLPFFEHAGSSRPYAQLGGGSYYERKYFAVGGYSEIGTHHSVLGLAVTSELRLREAAPRLELHAFGSAETGAYLEFSTELDKQQPGARFRAGAELTATLGHFGSMGLGFEFDQNTVSASGGNLRKTLATEGPYFTSLAGVALLSLIFPF